MNKQLILLAFLFSTLSIFSQTITLTFNGLPEDSENIYIENVTNGTSTTLIGENTITLTSGAVDDLFLDDYAKAYPNPFINEVSLEFYTFYNNVFDIKISNILGQNILSEKLNLQIGSHKLKFLAPNSGFYSIQIKSKLETKSFSVICKDANNKNAKISIETFNKFANSNNKSINGLTFTIGDVLKYTANNNNVLSTISDAPTSSETYTFLYDCIDYENNAYSTAKVGNQWWMAENLKSTKYANGSSISGSYAYENSSANEDVYGRLYTWEAVMHGASGNNNNPSGVQGVCPNGWHVPSELEWDELRDALGGKIPMHGKVKEVGTEHWSAPNSDATNESGLTVIPGGLRWGDDGTYQYIGNQAFFWNTTDDLSGTEVLNASGYTFFNETSYYDMYTWNPKTQAQSIRCVKD